LSSHDVQRRIQTGKGSDHDGPDQISERRRAGHRGRLRRNGDGVFSEYDEDDNGILEDDELELFEDDWGDDFFET
jgi:hypothetical protein